MARSRTVTSCPCPGFAAAGTFFWLFPYTPVSLELSQRHCTGSREGRKAAESPVRNRQRTWLNIQDGGMGMLRTRKEALELFQASFETSNLLISRRGAGQVELQPPHAAVSVPQQQNRRPGLPSGLRCCIKPCGKRF